MGDIEKTDLSNFCETSEEGEIAEKRIEKFKETVFPTTVDDNDN